MINEILKSSTTIQEEFKYLSYFLDERGTRLWCATKAMVYNQFYGRGGVTAVHEATGVSRRRIYAGIKEIEQFDQIKKGLIRKTGGGRKPITEKYPGLLRDLEHLVEPLSRGDPQSPLRWTCKSTRKLAQELNSQGYSISPPKVGDLLKQLDYSLQSNRKTEEGGTHPDRNAQFEYINNRVKLFQKEKQPVISVDTKKKENIGNYKNAGQEYHQKGHPEKTKVYDFIDKELGKVAPYGIYDIVNNNGFVNVGITSDTAEFAVNSIRNWWSVMGRRAFPKAKKLLITADGGGSNGYRVRLWKLELQKLVNKLNLTIYVCHFPPGTSKWNKIEHKMFSFISKNWRGKPLVTRETVINLISHTTTKTGLTIKAKLDENKYQTGIKVADEEFEKINIEKSTFHGEWNYIIKPQI
jgi:hypothetical protein